MFFSEQKHQTFPCRIEIPFPSKKESSIWEWVKVNCRKRRTENTKKWKNREALVEGGKRKFQVEWGQQTEQSLVKNWKMTKTQVKESSYSTSWAMLKRGLQEVVRTAALLSQVNKIFRSFYSRLCPGPENGKLNNAQTLTSRNLYSNMGGRQ